MTQEAHWGFLHNGCQSEERKMEKNIMLHGSYIKREQMETSLYKSLTSYRVPILRRRIRSKTSLAAEGNELTADS